MTNALYSWIYYQIRKPNCCIREWKNSRLPPYRDKLKFNAAQLKKNSSIITLLLIATMLKSMLHLEKRQSCYIFFLPNRKRWETVASSNLCSEKACHRDWCATILSDRALLSLSALGLSWELRQQKATVGSGKWMGKNKLIDLSNQQWTTGLYLYPPGNEHCLCTQGTEITRQKRRDVDLSITLLELICLCYSSFPCQSFMI